MRTIPCLPMDSTRMHDLLRRVYEAMPPSPVKDELFLVVARLEGTCSDSGCPTCGSTFFNFEERDNKVTVTVQARQGSE